MASLNITTRAFVPWPVSGSGGQVVTSNPDPVVPIYVMTFTSGGVGFAMAKVQPLTQVTIAFPAGGTCRAYSGRNITGITVV